jgi:hypothetical protein
MVTTAKVIPLFLRLLPVRREGDQQACEVPSFVLDLHQLYGSRAPYKRLRVLSGARGRALAPATRSRGPARPQRLSIGIAFLSPFHDTARPVRCSEHK